MRAFLLLIRAVRGLFFVVRVVLGVVVRVGFGLRVVGLSVVSGVVGRVGIAGRIDRVGVVRGVVFRGGVVRVIVVHEFCVRVVVRGVARRRVRKCVGRS